MPEAERDFFTGNLADFAAVNVNAPLTGAVCLLPSDCSELFHKAGEAAAGAGDKTSAAVYEFLGLLCSVAEAFDANVQPFAPLMQSDKVRTFLPADLSVRDLDAVAEFAKRATDPVLRARLGDILWVQRRDHGACAEAAKGYLGRARLNDSKAHWVLAIPAYQRALQLAAALGRAKPLFQEIAEAVITAARDESIDHLSFRNLRLMRLMLRVEIGNPIEFAGRSADMAEASHKAGHLEHAQAYREIEAEWQKIAGHADREKAARLAAGELMVEIAELRAKRPTGGAMAAASMLVDAIEALRRAGGDRARVEQLRSRLTELQAATRASMGEFSHKFDITDQVKAAREHVAQRSFPEALLRFVFGIRTADPTAVRKEVLELAQQQPLSSIIDAAIMDEKGRTIAHEPGLWGKAGAELEAAIEVKMFSHAAKFIWRSRVSTFINPARLQILNDHQPSFEEISGIVRNNPFVPPGHEEIFLRGLHAGFHGDFLVAVHLLVPQVENSLRYLLEEQGIDVSNLQSDRTQPVKILGALLGMEHTKRILGTSLHFEIRGHLIEKSGYDFRNRVAHGFVGENECYSAAALAVWWLVLRLCLHFAISGGREVKEDDAA